MDRDDGSSVGDTGGIVVGRSDGMANAVTVGIFDGWTDGISDLWMEGGKVTSSTGARVRTKETGAPNEKKRVYSYFHGAMFQRSRTDAVA